MKISLIMLLSHNEEPFLKYSLESLPWLDEYVFVNMAKEGVNSNLNTVAMFRDRLGYKKKTTIIDYYSYYDDIDFSKARNLAIEKSTGDYILTVDADEVFYQAAEEQIRGLDFSYDSYSAKFIHFMIDAFHYEGILSTEILFDRKFRYEHKVHETLMGNRRIFITDILYCHFGYIKGNENLLERWKLYARLQNKEGIYDYLEEDIEHLLDPRLPKISKISGNFPEVMEEWVPKRIIDD